MGLVGTCLRFCLVGCCNPVYPVHIGVTISRSARKTHMCHRGMSSYFSCILRLLRRMVSDRTLPIVVTGETARLKHFARTTTCALGTGILLC